MSLFGEWRSRISLDIRKYAFFVVQDGKMLLTGTPTQSIRYIHTPILLYNPIFTTLRVERSFFHVRTCFTVTLR
jgi:hypothetical protein